MSLLGERGRAAERVPRTRWIVSVVGGAILVAALSAIAFGASGTPPAVLISVRDVEASRRSQDGLSHLHVSCAIASQTGEAEEVRVIWYLSSPSDKRPWIHPSYAVPWRTLTIPAYGEGAERWDVPVSAVHGTFKVTVVLHRIVDGGEVHVTAVSPLGPPLRL